MSTNFECRPLKGAHQKAAVKRKYFSTARKTRFFPCRSCQHRQRMNPPLVKNRPSSAAFRVVPWLFPTGSSSGSSGFPHEDSVCTECLDPIREHVQNMIEGKPHEFAAQFRLPDHPPAEILQAADIGGHGKGGTGREKNRQPGFVQKSCKFVGFDATQASRQASVVPDASTHVNSMQHRQAASPLLIVGRIPSSQPDFSPHRDLGNGFAFTPLVCTKNPVDRDSSSGYTYFFSKRAIRSSACEPR